MIRQRSPQFPHVALDRALAWSRRAHGLIADRVVSRAEFAASLGHTSVSGPAATKLATLRAYGLIELVGEGLRITRDAIIAGSSENLAERQASIRRLAQRPSAFRELQQFVPDEERIRVHLIKLGFPSFAAAQAASVFLDTCRLSEMTETMPVTVVE